MIADLDSDGILTMMMHNNPDKGSPLRGKAMFDEVMGHFGDRVQGIQGIWVYGDNLGGFNEAVRGGASLVSAAKKPGLEDKQPDMASLVRGSMKQFRGSTGTSSKSLPHSEDEGTDGRGN